VGRKLQAGEGVFSNRYYTPDYSQLPVRPRPPIPIYTPDNGVIFALSEADALRITYDLNEKLRVDEELLLFKRAYQELLDKVELMKGESKGGANEG
jgi:hypothetical protein